MKLTEDEERNFPDADDTGERPSETFEELDSVVPLTINCKDGRGIRYQGTFTFKVPNMRDVLEIGRVKSALLPVSVLNDFQSASVAEMISYLQVTIQRGKNDEKLPKWWKPMDFYDETPIAALYAEAVAYAKRFRGDPVAGREQPAGEAADDSAADDRGDVDGDVLPPKQRRTIHQSDSAGSASAGQSRRGVPG